MTPLAQITINLTPMNSLPKTREEVIQKLAENPEINRNWLESEAYKYGIDFDRKNDGSDDEFSKEEY